MAGSSWCSCHKRISLRSGKGILGMLRRLDGSCAGLEDDRKPWAARSPTGMAGNEYHKVMEVARLCGHSCRESHQILLRGKSHRALCGKALDRHGCRTSTFARRCVCKCVLLQSLLRLDERIREVVPSSSTPIAQRPSDLQGSIARHKRAVRSSKSHGMSACTVVALHGLGDRLWIKSSVNSGR